MDVQPLSIIGRVVRLEPLSAAHVPDLAAVGQDDSIWTYMPYPPVRSEADMLAQVRDLLARQARGTDLPFAVIHLASGRPTTARAGTSAAQPTATTGPTLADAATLAPTHTAPAPTPTKTPAAPAPSTRVPPPTSTRLPKPTNTRAAPVIQNSPQPPPPTDTQAAPPPPADTVAAPAVTDTAPAPTQASAFQDLVSLTSPIGKDANATNTVHTTPGTACSITVIYKSGPSGADGLGPTTAGGDGLCSGAWKVGTRTTAGTWSIVVTTGTVTKQYPFEVQ